MKTAAPGKHPRATGNPYKRVNEWVTPCRYCGGAGLNFDIGVAIGRGGERRLRRYCVPCNREDVRNRLKRLDRVCAFAGCGRETARRFCSGHAKQLLRRGNEAALTPLVPYRGRRGPCRRSAMQSNAT